MRALRILVPIAIGLTLLFGASGCISGLVTGPVCNDVNISSTPGATVIVENPCVAGGAWTAHDSFLIAFGQPSVHMPLTRSVLPNGQVQRQIVLPNVSPGSNPYEGVFFYTFDNGQAAQGYVNITLIPHLQVTVTATPPAISAGQSTHLQATVTGGTPPYSYSWSPLITPVNFPTLDAAPKQSTTFDITITDSTGQTASASVTVTVSASLPPVLAGITPVLGPTGGGTFVTITGDNFVAGVSVQFGSVLAQDGTVVERDARTITALTPPGIGTVDVTVTNPDNQSATLPGAFTYYPPLIASVSAAPQVIAPGATSQLQTSASGGVPPYLFTWIPDPSLPNFPGANPVVAPAATTVYTISVTDSLNNFASASATVTVGGAALQACVATFPPDQTVSHGVPVIFNAGCSTGPNPIKLFEWWASWNPSNPGLPNGSGQFLIRPVFTYPLTGRATVRLQVTDVSGATSAATYTFVIR